MPGTFKQSVPHKATIENIRDPEEDTIVAPSNQEPSNTFSSPPHLSPALPTCIIPPPVACPLHSVSIHPTAGVPIRRPVQGYPGVSTMGPGSQPHSLIYSSHHQSPIAGPGGCKPVPTAPQADQLPLFQCPPNHQDYLYLRTQDPQTHKLRCQ